MGRIRALLLAAGIALALLLPPAASAQFHAGDDDPAITAQRQKVFESPFDQKASHSEKLLELIAARFGSESAEYAGELQLHASNLLWVRKFAEAQQANARAVAILERLQDVEPSTLAFAKRALAKSMQVNGFPEDAVEPYGEFIAIISDVAFGCQRNVGDFFAGCSHDVKELGDFLTGYGMLLRDLGRSSEGIALFEREIARFDRRWAECGTSSWGFSCDDAATERRALLADFAVYLKANDRSARATEILAGNVVPRLQALSSCADEACAADYWMLRDYRDYRAMLAETDLPSMFAMDQKWLPVLARQPPYARATTEAAASFDGNYKELIDEMAQQLAAKAVEAGQIGLVRPVLDEIGMDSLLADQTAEADFEARLADLDRRIADPAFGEEQGRADLLLKKANLIGDEQGTEHEDYARALQDAGYAMRNDGQIDKAADLFRQSYEAMRAARGVSHMFTRASAETYAGFLLQFGREEQALGFLGNFLEHPENDVMAFYDDPARAASLNQSWFDPYEDLNRLKANYAELLLRTGGDARQALVQARHAATGVKAYRDALGFSRLDEMSFRTAETDVRASLIGVRRYREFHTLFADALWLDGVSENRERDAFLALQEASMGATSRAVAKAASERAAASSGATDLIEERAGIDAEIDILEANLWGSNPEPVELDVDVRNMPIGKVAEELEKARKLRGISDQDVADRARERQVLLDAMARKNFRRTEIDQEIARLSPGYFELVRPQALSVDDARALLGADEAFLIVVPTQFGTHSLVVTKAGISWHRSHLTEADLNRHVRRLLWDVGANIEVTYQEQLTWEGEGEGVFPFDRSTAHLLYRELVEPHEDAVAGKRHLFVAATGSLSSLPFAILVASKPAGQDGDPDALRSTDWLGDRHAIVQLPSLQSLELLRAVSDVQEGNAQLLLGFGDPVLEGRAVSRGTSANQRLTRASGLQVSEGYSGAVGNGKRLADPTKLRALARLPGTRAELRAMEQVFGPANSAIFLAEDATETRFREADLSTASVISFATHGLIAGEMDGLTEPGLVFTPPRDPSETNDGLLTASEVTSLSLGADWVILSACNTASGDGTDGAPGLSGLSRAFFFAGAKSLLASHWPVKDDIAAIMTVRVLKLKQADPRLSRAEALQIAMREIRKDRRDDRQATWAHPSAWAPFAYIGDVR